MKTISSKDEYNDMITEESKKIINKFSQAQQGQGLTTDRNDPELNEVGSNGRNKKYLVLSEEERAKGFVRPVRRSYKHVGSKPNLEEGVIRTLTEEEKIRYSKDKYVGLLLYDKPKGAVIGLYLKEGYDKLNGCGTVTLMGLALCETYARDPKFYGMTYCVGCNTHLPVKEFTWEEDGEVLGS